MIQFVLFSYYLSKNFTFLQCVGIQIQSFFFFLLFKNSCLFYYSCPKFPPFALCHPAAPHPQSPSPHCCPCPWVIHTCSLTNPFPFFPPFSALPLPLAAVSLFPPVSMFAQIQSWSKMWSLRTCFSFLSSFLESVPMPLTFVHTFSLSAETER